MRVVECVYVLSVGSHRLLSAELPHFAAGEVVFKTLVRIPPLFVPEECSRWYEPHENLETSVGALKRLRLQLFDSALHVLRGLHQLGTEGALVQGEGIAPFLIIPNRSWRYAAYQARRVSGNERANLESAFLRLSYLFFSNPCSHPPLSGYG